MEWNARIDEFIAQENRMKGTVLPVHRIYCQDDTDRSGGGLYNETVTRDTIGRFARALGDSNPLFSDPRYAEAGPYGGLIAPPLLECCICSTFIGGSLPRVRGLSVYDAGTRWERFLPIRPGDSFTASTTCAGVEEHSAAGRNDRILLRSHVIDLVNQNGGHASRLTARTLIQCRWQEKAGAAEKSSAVKTGAGPNQTGLSGDAAESAAAAGEEPAATGQAAAAEISGCHRFTEKTSGRPRYTEAELERVYRNMEAQFRGEFRRGAQIRYWESVRIGEELPEEIVGPYDEADGEALMAAIGAANAFATKWGPGLEKKRRWPIDPETGARRLPIDRHRSDLAARAQGLPRALAYGIHSQALLGKLAGDWMGDAGLLRFLDCRCRKPLYYGDLSIQRGRVTEKYKSDGNCFVVLQLEAVRQDGVVHTEAEALVQLR